MQEALLALSLVLSQLTVELQELKKEEKTTNFIEYLAICESGNTPNIIHWNDKNITGYPSYGKYGYQPHTFLNFGKKYGLFPKEFSLKESMTLIMNGSLQDEITKRAIEDNQHRHWLNCWKKYKLT